MFSCVANEMQEALRNIFHRPIAEITDAIQLSMIALESTVCEVTGDRIDTLAKVGFLYPAYSIGSKETLEDTREIKGHIREDKKFESIDAELIVPIDSSLCEFFVQRKLREIH